MSIFNPLYGFYKVLPGIHAFVIRLWLCVEANPISFPNENNLVITFFDQSLKAPSSLAECQGILLVIPGDRSPGIGAILITIAIALILIQVELTVSA